MFAYHICMAAREHSLLQNGCSFFTKNLPPSNDLEHWEQQKQSGDTCQLKSFHPTRWSPAAIFSLQVWHFCNKNMLWVPTVLMFVLTRTRQFLNYLVINCTWDQWIRGSKGARWNQTDIFLSSWLIPTSDQVPGIKCSLYARATKGSMKSGKVQACLMSSIAQGLNIFQLFSM
jgi:hypothetical protein